MPTQSFTTGNDSFTVNSAGTYDLDFLAGDDVLTVDGGDSTTAHMGDGNDHVLLKLGLAAIFGDAGADKFDIWAVDATVDAGADNDTINLRGGTALDALGGLGADRFNIFADTSGISLDGGDGNDTFFGYNHAITGTILGGAGNDLFYRFMTGTILQGGLGNDVYRVTVGSPATFLENVGEGTDSVQVARGFSYTLPDNIENISVQGFSGSLTTAATITGNALNNAIIGHNNAETIFGLDGNDRISAQGGNDEVHGGTGNDVLVGGTGTDSLFGDAGNDTLRGAGTATMTGGTGDDLYYIDSPDDIMTENSGQGTDTARVFINYTLADNVENGIVQNVDNGGVGLSLTGNALDNVLTGNHFSDGLFGLGGNDTLKGGAGNDQLDGGDGNDSLDGGSEGDSLTGGAGDDTLNGGTGGDGMTGGTGDDIYDVDDAFDLVVELNDEGADTVGAALDNYVLPANVENGIITVSSGLTMTGNALGNRLTGGAGADELHGEIGSDVLIGGAGDDELFGSGNSFQESLTPYNDSLQGGAGNDILHGGAGNDDLDGGTGDDVMYGGANGGFSVGINNDTYHLDSLSDQIVEDFDSGTDTVFVSVSGYTLAANVENGVVDYPTGLTLTGNTLANSLTGDAGNDVLNGGDGDDFLLGLDGNDTLDGGAGNDQLQGNFGDDVMIGGDGNDGFSDPLGTNSMTGGLGNDAYAVQNTTTQVNENNNEGTDSVSTSLAEYTLPTNVENGSLVILNGTLHGNSADNVLTGNSGNDTLDGLVGNDTLSGASGNDTLIGGGGSDSLSGGAGNDIFDFNAASESTAGAPDSITDFTSGTDKIDVSSINPNNGTGVFGWTLFPTGTAGQWWFSADASTPNLYHLFFDVDGGGADMKIDVLTTGGGIATTDIIG